MTRRVLTAMVGLPLLLLVIWAGFPWLTLVVAAVAALGFIEFQRLATGTGARVPFFLGATFITIFIVTGHLARQQGNYLWLLVILAGGAVVTLLWVGAFGRRGFLQNYLYTLAGPVLLGLFLAHALLLREEAAGASNGWKWLYFVILTTFATDTGAFFIGRLVGRHRLAPVISPAKTWEGAVGGLLWAVGAALALNIALSLSIPLWQALALGVIIGFVGQVGDLMESALKRRAEVKDSGTLLPGYGGMLDRLDSVVLTVPLVYYWVKLVV